MFELYRFSAYLQAIPLIYTTLIEYYAKNPLLETMIGTFLKNVSQKYEPAQANLIRRAVVVGSVAHQNNEIEEKRSRKAGNDDKNPTPYFTHPIEMAECMIPTSKEDPTFDWITIVATLLHDVPEDVKLNGIGGKEAWLSTIEEIFKDTEYQFMLTSIIDGVTERKIPLRNTNDETRKLYERLEKTPMYKMIISYIQDGGMRHKKKEINHIYSDERKRVAEVVYNLEHLFQSATETPDDLRIFLIKIADVWHNLQSPEWVKDIKVLRGRIAAGLADILGWNLMRNKIIVSLAKITDVTTPFTPHIDKNKTLFFEKLMPQIYREQTEDAKIARQVIPQMINSTASISPSFKIGFPIPHPDKKNPLYTLSNRETITLPQPEIEVTMPATTLINNLIKDFSSYRVSISDYRNVKRSSTVRIEHNDSLISRLINLLGRKQIDLIIKPGNRNSFTIRIKDDQPQVVDLFKLSGTDKSVLPNQIPEIGLLNSNFTENKDLLSTHIQALIGFCYEPSLIGQVGEGVVPIFHRAYNRLLFLPKTLRVQEASEILGISELKASYSGQILWDLYDSKYHSSLALRRIIEV